GVGSFDGRAPRLDRLWIPIFHAIGLRLHVERNGVRLVALRYEIQLAYGFIDSSDIEQHAGEADARLQIIRVYRNRFAQRRLGALFIKEGIVGAPKVQRGLAVGGIDLQSFLEMLGGFLVVVGETFVIEREAVVQLVDGGFGAAA